ncbi:MAG: hypothetical protein OEQ16_03180 [Gammaproteobacteria bacterium]|nr:hypothetical protein [Gammaproteobacteria bacterium]
MRPSPPDLRAAKSPSSRRLLGWIEGEIRVLDVTRDEPGACSGAEIAFLLDD